MTIGAKLTISFSGMVLLTLAVSSAALWSVRSLTARYETATGPTLQKAKLAGDINAATGDMLVHQRGMYLAAYRKDVEAVAASKRQFTTSADSAEASLRQLEPLVITAQAKRSLEEIRSILAQWKSAVPEIERLSLAGDAEQATSRGEAGTLHLYQRASTLADGIDTILTELARNDREAGAAEANLAMLLVWASLFLTAGAALIAIGIVRGLNRELHTVTSEMADTAGQVASAASQVAASSQTLAQGSSEQAATLEETSASSEELTSMTRRASENSHSAATLMNSVDQRVTDANRNLDQMVVSMQEINASSGKISRIIKVIDEIAFQTNILALNAAVEAARAGEAGMGFAVVAEEVRNLAQRSAQAAKDTAQLIEESISRSVEGKSRLEEVATSIRSITKGASEVKTLIDEVNAGSQEQARGIEQINRAVTQMQNVTQNSAATAEESASASEELNAMAEAMRNVVRRLEGLVGQQNGSEQDWRLRTQPLSAL